MTAFFKNAAVFLSKRGHVFKKRGDVFIYSPSMNKACPPWLVHDYC